MANILLLCLDRYPLSLAEGREHDIASMVFSIFFLLEMLIKLIGMGPTIYFKDTFNKFDSLIVLISIFDVSFFRALDRLKKNETFKNYQNDSAIQIV